MAQSENLPTMSQLQEMQEDLLFKEEEMKRAAATADNLEAREFFKGIRAHNYQQCFFPGLRK